MEINIRGTIMQNSILDLELNSIVITKGEVSKIAILNYSIVDTRENVPDPIVARLSVPIDTGQEEEVYELKTYVKNAKTIIRDELSALATKIDGTIPRN